VPQTRATLGTHYPRAGFNPPTSMDATEISGPAAHEGPSAQNDTAVVWSLAIQKHVVQSFTHRWAPTADRGREEREREIVASQSDRSSTRPLLVIRDPSEPTQDPSPRPRAPPVTLFRELDNHRKGEKIYDKSTGARLIPVVMPRLRYESKYPGLSRQPSHAHLKAPYKPRTLRIVSTGEGEGVSPGESTLPSSRSEAHLGEIKTAQVTSIMQSSPESTHVTLQIQDHVDQVRSSTASNADTAVRHPAEEPATCDEEQPTRTAPQSSPFLPRLPASFSLSKLGAKQPAERHHRLETEQKRGRSFDLKARPRSNLSTSSSSSLLSRLIRKRPSETNINNILPSFSTPALLPPLDSTIPPQGKPQNDHSASHPQLVTASRAFLNMEKALRERRQAQEAELRQRALEFRQQRASARYLGPKQSKNSAPMHSSISQDQSTDIAYTAEEQKELALPLDESPETDAASQHTATSLQDHHSTSRLPVSDNHINDVRTQYADSLRILVELDELERALESEFIPNREGHMKAIMEDLVENQTVHTTDMNEVRRQAEEAELFEQLREGRVLDEQEKAQLQSMVKEVMDKREEAEWELLQQQYANGFQETRTLPSNDHNQTTFSAQSRATVEYSHRSGAHPVQNADEGNAPASTSTSDPLHDIPLDVQAEAYFVYRHFMDLERQRVYATSGAEGKGYQHRKYRPANTLTIAGISRGLSALGYSHPSAHPLMLSFVDKPSWTVPTFESFVVAYNECKTLESASQTGVTRRESSHQPVVEKLGNAARRNPSTALSLLSIANSPRYSSLLGISSHHPTTAHVTQSSEPIRDVDTGLGLIVRVLNQKRARFLQQLKKLPQGLRFEESDSESSSDDGDDQDPVASPENVKINPHPNTSATQDVSKTVSETGADGSRRIGTPIRITPVPSEMQVEAQPKGQNRKLKRRVASNKESLLKDSGIILASPSVRIPEWVPPRLATALSAISFVQVLTAVPRRDSNGPSIAAELHDTASFNASRGLTASMNSPKSVRSTDGDSELAAATQIGSVSGLAWSIDNGGVFRTSDEEYIQRMLAKYPLDVIWTKLRKRLAGENEDRQSETTQPGEGSQNLSNRVAKPSNPHTLPISLPVSLTARLNQSIVHPLVQARRRERHSRAVTEEALGYRRFAQTDEATVMSDLVASEAPVSQPGDGTMETAKRSESNDDRDPNSKLQHERNEASSEHAANVINVDSEQAPVTREQDSQVDLPPSKDASALFDEMIKYAQYLRSGFRDRRDDELYTESAADGAQKRTFHDVESHTQEESAAERLEKMMKLYQAAHDAIFEEEQVRNQEGENSESAELPGTRAERDAKKAAQSSAERNRRMNVVLEAFSAVRDFVQKHSQSEVANLVQNVPATGIEDDLPPSHPVRSATASESPKSALKSTPEVKGPSPSQELATTSTSEFQLPAELFEEIAKRFPASLVAKAAASHLLAPPLDPSSLSQVVLPNDEQQRRLVRVLPPALSEKVTGVWKSFGNLNRSEDQAKGPSNVIVASPSLANLLQIDASSSEMPGAESNDQDGDDYDSPSLPEDIPTKAGPSSSPTSTLTREIEKSLEVKNILRKVITELQNMVQEEANAQKDTSSKESIIATPLHLAPEEIVKLEMESQASRERAHQVTRSRKRFLKRLLKDVPGASLADMKDTHLLGEDVEINEEDEDEDDESHSISEVPDYSEAIDEIDALAAELLSTSTGVADLLHRKREALRERENAVVESLERQKSSPKATPVGSPKSGSGSSQVESPARMAQSSIVTSERNNSSSQHETVHELDVAQLDDPKFRDLITPAVLLASTANSANIALDAINVSSGSITTPVPLDLIKARLQATDSQGSITLQLHAPVKPSTTRLALLAARLALETLCEITTASTASRRITQYQTVRSLTLSAAARLSKGEASSLLRSASLLLTSLVVDMKAIENSRMLENRQRVARMLQRSSEGSETKAGPSGTAIAVVRRGSFEQPAQGSLEGGDKHNTQDTHTLHDRTPQHHPVTSESPDESSSLVSGPATRADEPQPGQDDGSAPAVNVPQGPDQEEAEEYEDGDEEESGSGLLKTVVIHEYSLHSRRTSSTQSPGGIEGHFPHDITRGVIPDSSYEREKLIGLALATPAIQAIRPAFPSSEESDA